MTVPIEAPAWVNAYTGTPYVAGGRSRDGADCWGLFRLVQKDRWGRDLPLFDGMAWSKETSDEIARVMSENRGSWRPIWEKSSPTEPLPDELVEQPGDGLLIRMRARPIHVATVVAPGWMLHTDEGHDALPERFRSEKWKHRIVGIYRYAA